MSKVQIIRKLNKLMAEYEEECEYIAENCAEEGYPAYGRTYEARRKMVWINFYRDTYEKLLNMLEGE